MGEVWRARDTKLGREAAIKTLPAEFAEDTNRVARFEREARLLASLNHPNIAAIHGFEEDNGTHFIVMELVEGDTLADRLRQGAIPTEESLKLALQITDALESAHDKGVIHRDLKPANVKVTDDGRVKVLDFGLAKAFAGEDSNENLSNSPTLSMQATQQGMILGTAAYMSPEQAKGRTVDKRTDIWAFGCVLYEMLTGTPLFDGEDVSDVLAAVLKSQPNWDALPAGTSVEIRRLLRRCLARDLRERLPDIGTARLDIADAAAEKDIAGSGTAVEPASTWRHAASLAVGAVALVVATALVVRFLASTPIEPAAAPKLFSALPAEFPASPTGVTLSPDGRDLVFAANDGSVSRLYRRSLDDLEVRPIPGTEGARAPFFSPEGDAVGFFANASLKTVSLNRGPPLTVTPIAGNLLSSTGVWAADDSIIFSSWGDSLGLAPRLWRVSAGGGTPQEIVVDLPTGSGILPYDVLPDDRRALVTFIPTSLAGSAIPRQSGVLDLATGTLDLLVVGRHPHYADTGHLLFWRYGSIWAAAFDMGSGRVVGNETQMTPGVAAADLEGTFDIARDGSLAYIPGSGAQLRQMVWVDASGEEQTLNADPAPYGIPRVSTDGRVVVQVEDSDFNLWLYDRALAPLTASPGEERDAVWSPDGRVAYYATGRDGGPGIFLQSVDRIDEVERLTEGPNAVPQSFSPDGARLVFVDLEGNVAGTRTGDIIMVRLDGDKRSEPLVASPDREDTAVISPDSKYLAFERYVNGQSEVFVGTLPDVGRGTRVSINGGSDPVWASSRILFYRTGTTMIRVEVGEGTPSAWVLEPFLDVSPYSFREGPRDFDIAPDGRFLMLKPTRDLESNTEKLLLFENWFEELKDRVP